MSCGNGCDMAIVSYHIWPGTNLTYISHIFNVTVPDILKYNPEITNQDSIISDTRINVPFSCDCLNGDFLGHTFVYKTVFGDTYKRVATMAFANLTTEYWLKRVNNYDPTNIPDYAMINVTVNCSCGDGHVSDDYGLFATYPLLRGENLSTVAVALGVPVELLEKFNPGLDFGSGSGIVFVPARDAQGNFPPLNTRSRGLSRGAIAGITVAAIVGATFFAVCLNFVIYRSKKIEEESFLQGSSDEHFNENFRPTNLEKITETGPLFGVVSPRPTGITVDKSVEFSYEELAKATNNFSMENKIGQGGFGAVFYGVVKGERTAIKKMDMQASKEFLAELKVLTHVHHLNLVRLIGYCVEGSLFLVYEYIENGNLGWNPLSWSARVQIALDAARGLEYIHEHTVPLYIHRDIKSANILIDKDFRAKVADFGLTKLTEVGSTSFHTRLVGTFGYMPPESREVQGMSSLSRMDLGPNSTLKASSRGEDCPSPYKQTTSPFPNQCGPGSDTMSRMNLGPNSTSKASSKGRIVQVHISKPPVHSPTNVGLLPILTRYAQYGDVSPKVDVYAFGVVLYELISAKEAIVKTNEVITESKGLVALFEDVLHQSGAREGLRTVVDPKLGDDYSLDSVCKVAQLAKACTHENPQLRPSMRSIVVALMTLSSSSTEDWDIGSFYENQGLVHFMSGR
ncbi:Chitin elicitor receptor kinase 1 [Capsicum baccatum]|uniref:Chitin elicitor receptor kinase 1 n=1 Tax=Capsicum baccatum TaxID=33114 RepID=A0A2G2XFS2_CAPBA|nr:Chitin elicitor receptor kinase 1 [Capsicum baccatum]